MRFQRQRNLADGLLNLSTPASKVGVVIGAIALICVCGFFIYRGLTNDPTVKPPTVAQIVLECEKCHAVKEFTREEAKALGREKLEELTLVGMDCTNAACGGKKSMKWTLECPVRTCHAHYLRPKFGEKETCPKCGADYTQAKIANP